MKTKADEFSQDLVITSLIYILIFAFGYLLSSQYQLEKQKVETLVAQKVAVELYEEKKVVEDRLDIAHENSRYTALACIKARTIIHAELCKVHA